MIMPTPFIPSMSFLVRIRRVLYEAYVRDDFCIGVVIIGQRKTMEPLPGVELRVEV